MAGKIVIADSAGAQRNQISEALRRAGYQVVAETADMGQTLRKVRSLMCDLVIVDAGLEGGKGLKTALIIDEDQLAAVLMLVNRETLISNNLPYLIKPVYDYTLIPAVETALLYWRRYGKLKTEINRLEEKLEARKAMDRAKGLLINRLQMAEPDAHRFIQKEAMNRGLTLLQVAREIISRLDEK